MIVAVGDFNMGAMENKGLNIFNTRYVLANPATATDADYASDRIGRRPRVLPQLDRQPRHLPRLVPAEPEGRPDGLSRPGVQHGHGREPRPRAPSSASRTCACCASSSSPRTPARWRTRCGPDSYVEINNFYTVDRLRERRRGRAHDADAGRPRRLRARHHARTSSATTARPSPATTSRRRSPTPTPAASSRGAAAVQALVLRRPERRRVTARGRYDAPSRTYTLGLEQAPTLGTADGQRAVRHPARAGPGRPRRAAMPLRLEDEPASATATARVLVLDERARRSSPSSTSTSRRCRRCCAASRRRSASSTATATPSCSSCCATTATRSTAGKPASGWRPSACLDRARRRRGRHRSTPASSRRCATCCATPRSMRPSRSSSLTLPSEAYVAEQLDMRRSAARSTRRARRCGAAARAQALLADWEWAFEAHQVNGGYSPDPVSAGRRALANLALAMLCLAARRSRRRGLAGPRLPALQGRGEHDRSPRRAQRAARLRVARSPSRRSSASMRCSSDDAARARQVVLAAGRARPSAAATCFERVKALLGASATSASRNPNRARSVIGAFCMRQPGRLSPRRRRRLCVLGRPRPRARRRQPAARVAARPRARPLDAARRAVSQRGARGDRARRRAAKLSQRHCARSSRARSPAG